MTAFSRSRLLTLVLSAIASVVVAIACATQPPDPDGGDDDDDCDANQTDCGDYCSNLAIDTFNCGACGRPCAMGQTCSAGQCTCLAPFIACPPGGTTCVLPTTDVYNCGQCGNVCPPSAQFCAAGTCSATCNLMTCGTACTSLATDPLNCGMCNAPCALGQTCNGGVCACAAGTMLCNGSCATSCGTGGTGGIGTGGTSGSVTGGAGGAGGAAPTGGASGAATGGSGGMPPVMKDCATKVTPMAPTLTDFESYDGMMPAYGTGSWVFTIGPTATPAYAGLYALSEGFNETTMMPPAAYTLAMSGGANGSNWAARAVNMTTTDWGGGLGLWMGCVNATTYTGISFYVRGSSPMMTGSIGLAMEDTSAPSATNPAGGGTCTPAGAMGCAGPSYTFPLTADWTQISVPWATFMPGRGASDVAVMANGDEITGMSFGVGMNYVENPVGSGTYLPEPGAFEIAIDNIAFTQ